MNRKQPNAWWRRAFHWPLFTALAAVHLLVLPAVFAEQRDDVAALAAGVCYVALALADRRSERRRLGTRAI